MSVLQKIRSYPKLLIGIIAVALLAFIFPWNEVGNFINSQKFKAFEVDGESVSTEKYYARITEFENYVKKTSGQTSLDENTNSQIRDYVFEQMVNEQLLDKECKKLGLSVSDEELQDLQFGANPSPILSQIRFFADPQTGQYSPQGLNQFLQNISVDPKGLSQEAQAELLEFKSFWNTTVNMIKYEKLLDKYNTLLVGTVQVSDLDVKINSEAAKSTADIAYVINRYSSIADSSVSVSDKEIEKLYSDRKNNFKTYSDMRRISYFAKEVVPSQNDFSAVEKEINEARVKLATTENPALVVADYSEVPYQDIYFNDKQLPADVVEFAKNSSVGDIQGPFREGEAFKMYKLVDRAVAPDSVHIRMIVIPEGTNKALASNKIDSLINVINGGKEFAAVANDLNPQSNGGDLGTRTEAELAQNGKEFVNACFNAATGSLTKLNLQGSYQIIKVESKSQPITKYKLALIQMPVTVSDPTLAAIDNDLNQFVADNMDGTNFVKNATEKGYNIVPHTLISSANANLSQISGSRQVINWAFNEDKGTIKKFDLTNHKIIAFIEGSVDAGYLPISEVKDVLKAELAKDKKAEKMIADMKAKNISSLDAYAQSLGAKVDTVKFVTFTTQNIMGIGREVALNVYAEVGQINKLEGPVKGDNGVLVMNMLNKVDQSKEFNAIAFKQTANNQNMYRVSSLAMQALKNKNKVKDNRAKFF